MPKYQPRFPIVNTVFISYSHKDEPWKDKLLPHLRTLEQAGVDMKVWQDRQIDAGAKWYPEIQDAMAHAAVAILLISADYLASGFCVKEEVPFLLDRQEKQGMLLIPVLVRQCPWKTHRWLADRQMLPRDGKCVAVDFPGDQADTVFSGVAESIYLHFAQLSARPQTAPAIPASVQRLAQAEAAKIPVEASEPLPPIPKWPVLISDLVDLSHLPETGAALFGRDEELSLLDKVWAGQGRAGDGVPTRVLAFKAQGGVGKSTLINHWLAEMKRDHFRGATRVFGWSFYSQGVREQGAPSAETFVAAALRFFGDEAMAASSASLWDKGERLAKLVGAERALLVLDGMEPLQSAQPTDRGKLRDAALEALLRGLARQSAGLCIITTREPLAELGRKAGIVERDLEQITPQAGRALLRAAHVVGTDRELETLAERFGPHALAISLLAVYLHEQPGHGIGPARALEQMPRKTPVDRVLAGFEQWLGSSAELEALRLLGFFDRPADEGCLRALRAEPAIPGLTGLLPGMADADWHRVLARLDKLRLIHTRLGDSGKRFVDTHPLIREHFAQQLRDKNPAAWRAAHRRLYEMFLKVSLLRPQRLEEMMPLYRAVAHGCQAGLHNQVLDDVYGPIIQRGRKGFAQKVLGAGGEDLAALSWFFERPWTEVIPTIDAQWRAWLPGNAGSRLRALTRILEAIEPTHKSLEQALVLDLRELAAIRGRQFSELRLILGDVFGALYYAEQAIKMADTQEEYSERITERAVLADVLHAAGLFSEAKVVFQEAEELQRTKYPQYPLLYSLWGFRYCDLLLHQGLWSDVLERVAKTDKWPEMDLRDGLGLLDVPLELLSLAKCHLAQFDAGQFVELDQTVKLTEEAIGKLRDSGKHDFLPLGFLVRAAALRRQVARHSRDWGAVSHFSRLVEAQLAEAKEIAERCGMLCFQVDVAVERCWLAILQEQWDQAHDRIEEAKGLVKKTERPYQPFEPTVTNAKRPDYLATLSSGRIIGYHRCNEELEDAEAAVRNGRR